MNQHPVLDNLLSKLGLSRAEPGLPTSTGAATPVPKAAATEKNIAEVERRLDTILRQHHGSVEDRVFVVGLQKCREIFGDRWERSQEKIHDTIRSVLINRLSPKDMHIRRDDESYLIVFGTLSRKEAQIKCTIISEEIRQRLIGRKSVPDYVDVKTVTVAENGQIDLKDLPKIDTLLEAVVENLEKAEPPAEDTERKFFDFGGDPSLDEIEFIFRPMLAVRTKVISTFICIPMCVWQGRLRVSGYDVLGDKPHPKQYLNLDLLSLQKVSSELKRLGAEGQKSLVGVSVHFETLADSRRMQDYLEGCTTALARCHDRIIFEIVGLPDGIPQVRLVNLVSALRPHSRAVIARFTLENRNFSAFRTAGLHAVGIDLYTRLKREDRLMRQMEEFAKIANRYKLKTYILGLRSISLHTAAVASGYDYAAGHALTSIADAAEGAYVFHSETPYIRALDAKQSDEEQLFKDLPDEVL